MKKINDDYCAWIFDDEIFEWQTECGKEMMEINDLPLKSPKDFGFEFCPFCGKLIVRSLTHCLLSFFR